MSYNSCPYCFNKYKLKKNLNSHVALCKEYHRIQTDDSSNESLPPPKMLYRMLKDLIINQQNLEKEVLFLKNKLSVQQKKDIILWLNETTNRQLTIHENIKMGFSKWSSIFTIQQKHLKSVFDGGIIDGIQSVLLDKINSFGEREPKDIPIRAFLQKPGHLYIYDINISTREVTGQKNEIFSIILPHRDIDTTGELPEKVQNKGNMTAWSWRVAKNEDIEIIIENIRRKLLFEFTKWQTENRHLIDSSDEMKENEINYMLTFNCINISLEKRLENIKKWIYNTIKENSVVGCVEFN